MDGYLSKGSTEPFLVGFSVSIKLSPDNPFTFPTPVSPAQRRHTLSPFACVILKKKNLQVLPTLQRVTQSGRGEGGTGRRNCRDFTNIF